jgi:hypothetical protein
MGNEVRRIAAMATTSPGIRLDEAAVVWIEGTTKVIEVVLNPQWSSQGAEELRLLPLS